MKLLSTRSPPSPSKPPPDAIGLTAGGATYRLLEIAGRGGMANVWRGELVGAHGFKRPVAIKQMHSHLAANSLYVDMFVEEARVGAQLHAPNIAHVYDLRSEGGEFFMVMEWVEGIDLGSFLRYHNDIGARMPWELVAAMGIGICRALAAAHERTLDDGSPAPVIHRDVSPSNILLSVRGAVKLIDFGLALARDRSTENTQPGVVKGKMSYLSPEVVLGSRPTPACDQFAAGSVLWEAMSGHRLFDGTTDVEVYEKVRNAQVRPLRPLRRDAPKDLIAIVHRALASQPKDRFPTTREMAHRIAQVLQGAVQARDLHEHLAKSVTAARAHLGLGHGSRAPDEATPVLDMEPEQETEQSLWHRLPFFGSKKR
jgi:serine/threonine-protein kinase